MLPNFGSLRLGPPTGNKVPVVGEGEACVISGEEFRNGDEAWQLLVYVDKNLPPGTGEGQRDAPENIERENAYYDIMAIATHLAIRPYSPATRRYVVPSDRLDCVKLANTMISDPEEKFVIRDYENFYDIANYEFDWHGYYARNEAELLNDWDQDEDWNEGEFPIAGMSPVQRERSAPSEAERAAQAAAPPPPTNPPEAYYALLNHPSNRDGITRENYETTGLHIFLRLLEDLRYKDIDDVNTDLDDDAVERMIRVWLYWYVTSPSELCALWYRVKMLGAYDQRLINSGIGPRAYVLAKDAIVEFAKDMLLSDQPWTPEEWNDAPAEWMEAVRRRMVWFWAELTRKTASFTTARRHSGTLTSAGFGQRGTM